MTKEQILPSLEELKRINDNLLLQGYMATERLLDTLDRLAELPDQLRERTDDEPT